MVRSLGLAFTAAAELGAFDRRQTPVRLPFEEALASACVVHPKPGAATDRLLRRRRWRNHPVRPLVVGRQAGRRRVDTFGRSEEMMTWSAKFSQVFSPWYRS
jgi:hypothetical protein